MSSGKDQAYLTDGTLQQTVWAIGPLNSKDEVAKHYDNGRTKSKKASLGEFYI